MIKSINDLFNEGYEIFATVQTKDDAYDVIEEYLEHFSNQSLAIARYKRKPGFEDAYAVLVLEK